MVLLSFRKALVFLFFVVFITVVARRGHLEPLGNSGTIESLHERVGFINPREFLSDYVLKNKPVLMRGAILDSPAVQQWTDEFLTAKAASNPESVITVEYGKKETRQNGTSTTFANFLKIYNESDIYMVSGIPHYLLSDVIIPWPLQCDDYNRSFEDNVMWFSSGGTKSVIHHDGYENINCLIRGKKRFLFVNTTKYEDIEDKIIDFKNGTYGSVDVESVDLDKYPFYEGMEFFEANLQPGDCVYSPYLWIHQVESWNSNIAVNIWWFKEINTEINPKSCTEEFKPSLTFKAATFHRTTVLEDPEQYHDTLFALRHGFSRFVFVSASKAVVKPRWFIQIMTNKAKKLPNNHRKSLLTLFACLDTNKNRQIDLQDLQIDMNQNIEERFHAEGIQWMSTARLYNYPIPVDFTTDEYKSIQPFKLEEMPNHIQQSERKKPKGPIAKVDTSRQSEPQLVELIQKSISEHDEL